MPGDLGEPLRFASIENPNLFTSYLLNVVGVEERVVTFIVGHQVKSMTGGRYGNKLITPRMKLDLFKDTDFGVDLSLLMP